METMPNLQRFGSMTKIIASVRTPIMLFICLALAGCGAAAAPCRVDSAALKIVPLVGHVAAAPTDACADAIDPD
jgi:hypothetical protein